MTGTATVTTGRRVTVPTTRLDTSGRRRTATARIISRLFADGSGSSSPNGRGVVHPGVGGRLLEPRVVEDQRPREQGQGDHRRDHQHQNVIPKLHPASVRTTKMGGPEMAPHTPPTLVAPRQKPGRASIPRRSA